MDKYQEAMIRLTMLIGAYMPEDKLKDCEKYLIELQELVDKENECK